MWHLVAQASSGDMFAGGAAAIGAVCCSLLPLVAAIAGLWKVFEKAGKPGWAAIVPIYNLWILVEISGKETFWFILYFIPIANLVASIMVSIALAEKFGKDALYGIGLVLVPFIMFPMLGFGEAQYQGAGDPAAAGI